jgi:phosphoserine phosphatase
MDTVLVAITSPQNLKLTSDHMQTAMNAVNIGGELDWLSKAQSCQVAFAAPDRFDARQSEDSVRQALQGLPIDIAFVPTENRRKKLLVADMDSTIIQQECIDELAEVAGIADKVVGITARAMAGELDFQDALRERLGLLEGLPEKAIIEVITKRLTFTPGARELVQTMKANGALTALLSGGFTHFTSFVSKICGFDEHQANVLEIEDGKLTGKAIEPIMDKNQKKRSLAQLTVMNGMTFADTMAVGDGANDLPMLQRSCFGVSLHGKPALRDGARFRVDHGDLTALLYLQGYHKDEFVGQVKSQSGVQLTTSS